MAASLRDFADFFFGFPFSPAEEGGCRRVGGGRAPPPKPGMSNIAAGDIDSIGGQLTLGMLAVLKQNVSRDDSNSVKITKITYQ